MPLNISIDVDGTLLDEKENVHPQTRNLIEQLKARGHRIQLWSTGGADYALRRATEKGLADLFDSFGAKPDVAIDDIPESARPVATIKADKHFLLHHAIELLESKIEGCVESALCPTPSLKQLVAEMQIGASEARARLGNLLLPHVPLHPIPFFGNLESAKVITIGLNPAITEFAKHRSWKQSLDEEDLTFRLVNYFRLAGICYPPAHGWFSDISEFLHIIRCPQKITAAHVDLCPWTSIAPIGLTAVRRNRFWNLVDEQMEQWLARTLSHARQTVKLIVILESPNAGNLEQERQNRTKQIIHNSLGGWDGQIRVKKMAQLVDWAWTYKTSLRNFVGHFNTFD
jgi:hypothetical protein